MVGAGDGSTSCRRAERQALRVELQSDLWFEAGRFVELRRIRSPRWRSTNSFAGSKPAST
jgi:hypothetical protein